MSESMWDRPSYFEYNGFPTKVIRSTADAEPTVWRFSPDTGGWRRDDDIIVELESNSRADVIELVRDDFIELTEWSRAHYVRGDGPVFALYETLHAVGEQAERESRPLTVNERALIRGLSRKTYVMFERDLAAKGAPGADPAPEA